MVNLETVLGIQYVDCPPHPTRTHIILTDNFYRKFYKLLISKLVKNLGLPDTGGFSLSIISFLKGSY